MITAVAPLAGRHAIEVNKVKYRMMSAIALLALTACGQDEAGQVVAEARPLVSGIDTEAMDNLVWGVTGQHPGRKAAN